MVIYFAFEKYARNMPNYSGMLGKELADKLARKCFICLFIGPKLSLGTFSELHWNTVLLNIYWKI